MAKRRRHAESLLLDGDPLYVGIDVGKRRHVAGFVSSSLLRQHVRFEACPTFAFEQSREDFRALVDRIRTYAPLEHVHVLMEQTGHYHRPLLQYLLEEDLPVYVMHVQRRMPGILKTDRRDALILANHLYNQLDRRIQVADKLHLVRRALPPSEAAAQLQGLMRHRYELIAESTRRKNKLTAICDELFPEFTRIFKNPNLPRALAVREAYPIPRALLDADEGATVQGGDRLSRAIPATTLRRLREYAAVSIGSHDPKRVEALVFEQTQLIAELRLLQDHLERLEARMGEIVEGSREGQILLSIPPVGPTHAATLLAAIGNVANFASAAALKTYLGWAPATAQSGSSQDRVTLARGGHRPAKQALYLVAWGAIRTDTEWAEIYRRLVPRKCAFDERTRSYQGRIRVIGRICGQIVTLIYALLRRDYELTSHLARVAPGAALPPPELYDRETHRRHRQGQYVPRPSARMANHLVLQPR
jgi:transposase